ncbi:MAG: alpha/beta hydrolase [Streptosporangiaceae bacterium]|jgi:pimeloyl-ACP methyl ester carboxylesterase
MAPELVRLAAGDARAGPGLLRRIDQRGCGLSGKPLGGYDTATPASDLVALMDALGHQRFAVAGHGTGMWIGYALAADHPDRVDRLAVAEAAMPAVSPSPPLFDAVRYYVEALAADPEALRGSFAAYRALDATIAQNEQRKTRGLALPVLAIGGAEGIGEGAANAMRLAADDVQSVVIPGCGHYYLEEASQEILATLTAFLAPYRESI